MATLDFQINPAIVELATDHGMQPLVRGILTAWAYHWHKQLLPKHFTAAAPGLYPGAYTRRTRLYMIRKAKRGHRMPMVWSGTMRRTLLGTPTVEQRGSATTGKSMRVTMKLPFARVANFWAGSRTVKSTGEQHDFHRELTAMNAGELNEMQRFIEERWAQAVRDKMALDVRAVA